MTRPIDKILVGLAFAAGLATIAGAWAFQLIGGLTPCDLCWGQRLPYYYGLPVLALVLVLWNRIPLAVWYVAIAAAIAIFAWGVYLGGYHAGVEYGWWAGPTHCTGAAGVELRFEDIATFGGPPVVPCDFVQFQLMGISLAGFNALISAGIVVMLLVAAWWQATKVKR